MKYTQEQVDALAKILRDAHAACVTWESMAEAALKHLFPHKPNQDEVPDQNEVPIGSMWFDFDSYGVFEVVARAEEEDTHDGKAYHCKRAGFTTDYVWCLPDPSVFKRVL